MKISRVTIDLQQVCLFKEGFFKEGFLGRAGFKEGFRRGREKTSLKPALPKKPSLKKPSLKRQTCCKSSVTRVIKKKN